MRDIAPNYTARVKLTYSSAGATHSMQFRGPRTTDAAGAVAIADKAVAFLNALSNARFEDWQLLSTQWCAADSDLFFDISPTITLNAGAVTNPTTFKPIYKAQYFQFVGKSAAGSRVSVYLYGVNADELSSAGFADFRVFNSENSAIATAQGVLNENAPSFYAADNNAALWRPYANIKSNDHWVHKARRG
jgi:hypothetical protein